MNQLYRDFAESEYSKKYNVFAGLDCIQSYAKTEIYWKFVYYWNLVNYASIAYRADDYTIKILLPEYIQAERKVEEIEVEADIGIFTTVFLAIYAFLRSLFS